MNIRFYLNLLEQAYKPVPISSEPTSGLWFRHESPYWLNQLKPLSYQELQAKRPEYDVAARMSTELEYHRMTRQNDDTSFLYATIVGMNQMEPPEEYPGFTYYFQLSEMQIQSCLFDIVDKHVWMSPAIGDNGLHMAIDIWSKHSGNFQSYAEKGLGVIDPRIEVIIPFSVQPLQFFPQVEDR